MGEDREEAVLAEALSVCMLSHYKFCAAGVLLGLPLSIHKKSYWPVTMAAAAGTAADYREGSANCRREREALMAFRSRKAEKQNAPPVASSEHPVRAIPQEAWQSNEQQGRPEE